MARKLSLAQIVFVSLVGCMGCAGLKPYRADLNGRWVQTTPPMVAKPISRKLFIMIDPTKLADEFPISNSSHTVRGFRSFMKSSLEKAISPYFQEVGFVEPGFAIPEEPHVLADLKMDSIEARNIAIGQFIFIVLRMQWALAIRPSEIDEYLFSFAGVGESESSYRTLEEGCQQMMKSALDGFLKSWAEKDVYSTLRKLDGKSRDNRVEKGSEEI